MAIFLNSDTAVALTGHRNSISGSYINTATVTAKIIDEGSTLYTIPLPYRSSTDGDYGGSFSAAQTATLTEGKTYIVEVKAISSDGTLTIHHVEVAGYAS